MPKLSKDEWISLFNKFINESDSYGEAIGKVQQYIVDNYSFSIEKMLKGLFIMEQQLRKKLVFGN
jgi:hypothetical protein